MTLRCRRPGSVSRDPIRVGELATSSRSVVAERLSISFMCETIARIDGTGTTRLPFTDIVRIWGETAAMRLAMSELMAPGLPEKYTKCIELRVSEQMKGSTEHVVSSRVQVS